MSEDLRIENKMQRKGLLNLLFNALEHSSSSKLVFVVINFLWKLSQFVENQKNIVVSLIFLNWIENSIKVGKINSD